MILMTFKKNWRGIEIDTWDKMEDLPPDTRMKVREWNRMKIDKMEGMGAEAGIPAKDLPKEFNGTVENIEERPDKNNSNCVYVKVSVKEMEEKTTTIKYSPMHLTRLSEALKSLKVEDFLPEQKYVFTQEAFSIGYPRHIPSKKL